MYLYRSGYILGLPLACCYGYHTYIPNKHIPNKQMVALQYPVYISAMLFNIRVPFELRRRRVFLLKYFSPLNLPRNALSEQVVCQLHFLPHKSSHCLSTVTDMPFAADSHSTLLVGFIGIISVTYFAARKMLGHDPREPPLAPQSIPIVGHMIGLSRSSFNYYVDLRYDLTPSREMP